MYISRRQRGDADALTHPLVAQGLGQLADAAFARCVGGDVGAACVGERGGDVDDLFVGAAIRRGWRMGKPVGGQGSREQERCGEVCGEDLLFCWNCQSQICRQLMLHW